MADVSLVCVREDAWKADLLAAALERYGFAVCRSASVFEDFSGYAAVVVLLSPGAARSDLVMGTAARALDWGKLIPVFVNLCHLPDRLAGVALHDLSAWDGEAEDPVVKSIAFHAQRLAGLPGRPGLGADRSPRRMAQEQLSIEPYGYEQQPQIGYEPIQVQGHAHAYGHNQMQAYIEPPQHEPYDYEANYRRGFNAPRETYFVAAAHNELEHYPYTGNDGYAQPLDPQAAIAPNDAARRRAYFMDARSSFADSPRSTLDYGYDEPAPRQRRPMPGLFSVIISAVALMSMAWVEEARTREVVVLRATPATATAELSAPASVDPAELKPAEMADAR